MLILNRKEARQQNLIRYYTGKTCLQGHIAERLVSNGGCLACVGERKSDYDKTYRAKHLDQIHAYDAARPRRIKKPDTLKAAKKRYYEKYKESVLAKMQQYRIENTEARAIYFKAYKKENAGQVAAWNAFRNAAKKQRTPVWVDSEELWLIKEVYSLAALRTKMFGFSWHVDHIVPLQGKLVSGLHTIANLQVIPASQNVQKSNTWSTK